MASILRVNTLTDASSNNSTAMSTINQGTAKSWVYLKGTDTFGIQDSFNTTSATDNGTGDYTTTRSNALSNDDYATSGIPSAASTGNAHYNFIVENQNNRTRTTTALRTWILNADYCSTGAVDAIDYSMTFMGDLA